MLFRSVFGAILDGKKPLFGPEFRTLIIRWLTNDPVFSDDRNLQQFLLPVNVAEVTRLRQTALPVEKQLRRDMVFDPHTGALASDGAAPIDTTVPAIVSCNPRVLFRHHLELVDVSHLAKQNKCGWYTFVQTIQPDSHMVGVAAPGQRGHDADIMHCVVVPTVDQAHAFLDEVIKSKLCQEQMLEEARIKRRLDNETLRCEQKKTVECLKRERERTIEQLKREQDETAERMKREQALTMAQRDEFAEKMKREQALTLAQRDEFAEKMKREQDETAERMKREQALTMAQQERVQDESNECAKRRKVVTEGILKREAEKGFIASCKDYVSLFHEPGSPEYTTELELYVVGTKTLPVIRDARLAQATSSTSAPVKSVVKQRNSIRVDSNSIFQPSPYELKCIQILEKRTAEQERQRRADEMANLTRVYN